MEHLVKPKISISRLILTVSIIAGIIIYAVFQLIKDKHSTTLGSLMENPARRGRSELVPNSLREDTATAEYQFAASITSIDNRDTTGHKNIEYRYYNGIKCYFLRLDSLTAKQIIETVSKYHHIPVDYRGKRLAKQDTCFSGTVSLDDDIKNIITILNRLNIYVKYDGKRIIAGGVKAE